MGRSYIIGILIGGLSSVLGLSAVSLMAPPGTESYALANNRGSGEAPEPEAPSDEMAANIDAAPAEGNVEEVASQEAVTTESADEAMVEAESDAEPETAVAEADTQTEEAEPETAVSEIAEADPTESETAAAEVPAIESEEQGTTATATAADTPETAEMAAEPAANEMAAVEAESTKDVPDAPVVEVPAGSEFARARPEENMVVPASEDAPAAAAAPAVTMPEVEPAPALAEVKPAAIPEGQSKAPEVISAPEPAAPIVLAEAPSAAEENPLAEVKTPPVLAVEDAGEASVLPDTTAPDSPVAAAEPEAPAAEEEIAATDPVAQEMAETPSDESVDDAPAAVEAPEPAEAIEPAETEIAEAGAAPEAPDTDAGNDLAEITEPDADEAAAPARRLPQIEAPAEAPEAEAETEIAQVDEPEGETANGNGPVILDLSPKPPVGAASAPQPGFAQRTGVKINRLPRIGDDAATDENGAGSRIVVPAALPADASVSAAATRFAAPFDNSAGLPFLAIVVADIGEGAGGLDWESLASFGRPVTIAIDPSLPDAKDRAIAYRLAGHEVAILAPDLPEGATASDLEIAYQSYASVLPEAVALIGTPDSAFQSDRRVAQHMVALLGTEGRGLVTYDRGLNPARQAAIGEGLANATVFRSLDADEEGASTIARYLDRAAFEAARQGEVVIVATSRPETISALQEWIAAGAKGSAIAPVSAAMGTGS